MKKFSSLLFRSLLVAVLPVALIYSCKKEEFKPKKAEAELFGTVDSTSMHGTLMFTEQHDGSVKMDMELYVPTRLNQSVAVHLHEHGMCGNAGADAHGHWNPTGKQHGKWGSASFHSGDIGNIQLDENGRGKLTIVTKLWSIGGPDSTNILNRGVIVHGGVDDYVSQPTGNSGARIGCGVITVKTPL